MKDIRRALALGISGAAAVSAALLLSGEGPISIVVGVGIGLGAFLMKSLSWRLDQGSNSNHASEVSPRTFIVGAMLLGLVILGVVALLW
jgi:hypothetical protein